MEPITIITPQLKDEILIEMLSYSSPHFDLYYHEVAPNFGITPDLMRLVFDQFDELGLIVKKSEYKAGISFTVTANAHDFYRRGGFSVQEEILKANIEKLGRELDILAKQLSPSLAQKSSELSTIAASILQAVSMFKS